MCEIRFSRCSVHLTVATLVSAVGFPAGKGDCGIWRAGRHKERQGLHPDIMFTCTGTNTGEGEICELYQEIELLPATPSASEETRTLDMCRRLFVQMVDAVSNQMVNAHAPKTVSRLKNIHSWHEKRRTMERLLSDNQKHVMTNASKEIKDFLRHAKTTMERALEELNALEAFIEEHRCADGKASKVKSARILVRVFPSGIAVLTLSVSFSDKDIKDKAVDDFLTCLDPRRRLYADLNEVIKNTKLPPDLISILDALLLDLRVSSVPDAIWEQIGHNCYVETYTDEQWNEEFGRKMLNLGFSVRHKPAKKISNRQSEDFAAQMLPYVTIDCEVEDPEFWNFDDSSEPTWTKHRRLYHTAVGSYLSLSAKSECIPVGCRRSPDQDVIKSFGWSKQSILFGTTRGTCVVFSSAVDGSSEWSRAKTPYWQAVQDAVEQTVGMWAALGTLNVHVDGILRTIAGEPLRHSPALSDVAAARTTLTYLLGEPSIYQLEGGSVLAFQDNLRTAFRIDHLRNLLFSKFESVKDLHDLQMHLTALRQIRREHDSDERL